MFYFFKCNPFKARKEEEMRHKIKQLEEENDAKQQTLTTENKNRIRELEDSLVKVMRDKVSFSLRSNQRKTYL